MPAEDATRDEQKSRPDAGVGSDGSAVATLLAHCRQHLDRVAPHDLADEIADGALIVDIRPIEQRARDGDLPGAVVMDRNVLEWRLDPTSPYRIAEVGDTGRRIVLVCNEGYGSSLAAYTLQQLGLSRATDLAGGFQAWMLARRAGEAAEARDLTL